MRSLLMAAAIAASIHPATAGTPYSVEGKATCPLTAETQFGWRICKLALPKIAADRALDVAGASCEATGDVVSDGLYGIHMTVASGSRFTRFHLRPTMMANSRFLRVHADHPGGLQIQPSGQVTFEVQFTGKTTATVATELRCTLFGTYLP